MNLGVLKRIEALQTELTSFMLQTDIHIAKIMGVDSYGAVVFDIALQSEYQRV